MTNTIREIRTNMGLTQQQFADLVGIPFRTIQNWEGGQRKCPEYVEKMILEKLDRLSGSQSFCPHCGAKIDK